MSDEAYESDVTKAREFRVRKSHDGDEYALEWMTMDGTIMTVTTIKISREGLRLTLAVLDGLRGVLP